MNRCVVALLALLAASPGVAREAVPTMAEAAYIQAVAQGQIDKARELATLGGINPHQLAGRPLVSHLTNPWWNIANPAGWSEAIFAYVFDELKQDPNTEALDPNHTVFSKFCNYMTRQNEAPELVSRRTLARVTKLIAAGAQVSEHPVTDVWMHQAQPLPRCLSELETLYPDSSALTRDNLYKVIALYLANGANPNYEYRHRNSEPSVPLSAAVRRYDVRLLDLLLAHKADLRHIIKLDSQGNRSCRTRSILTALPEPRDVDVPVAEPFLRAYAAAGGDILAPVVGCGQRTLKQAAVELGQLDYARMMLRFEQAAKATAAVP